MTKHKFRIGERVRLNYQGARANIVSPKYWEASGIVIRVDKSNSPTVRWDHRKSAAKYAATFIDPDWRDPPGDRTDG